MRILLVGHRGYIASGLSQALATRHEVVGWGSADDVTQLTAERIRELAPDAIVNCAVAYDRTSSALALGSPSDRVNVGGIRALVEALGESMIRLIQISTKDVFGPVYGSRDVIERPTRYELKFCVNERQLFDPRTAYAKSKLIAEFVAEAHPHSTVIRLSSCYTDFNHPRGAWVLRMTKAALRGESIVIEGSGKQVRDPLHVDDLARLVEAVLSAPGEQVSRLKINAGGGSENTYSVREIIELIDPAAAITTVDGGDFGFAFDNALAEQVLGWRPIIRIGDRLGSLREVVRRAMAAHDRGGG